jgi:hypothetical protein
MMMRGSSSLPSITICTRSKCAELQNCAERQQQKLCRIPGSVSDRYSAEWSEPLDLEPKFSKQFHGSTFSSHALAPLARRTQSPCNAQSILCRYGYPQQSLIGEAQPIHPPNLRNLFRNDQGSGMRLPELGTAGQAATTTLVQFPLPRARR